MNLGVVAQGFKMPHALHGIFNGFLVENPPVVQRYVQAKALLHQSLKDFQLHPAHDLHMNLPVFPQEPELGFFLFQQPQLGQHHRRIRSCGKAHPVGHHRLQRAFLPLRFRSQRLARIGLGQARHRHQFSRFRDFRSREFVAGIGSQLQGLLLYRFPLCVFVSKGRTNLEGSAGDFHPGQAVSLRIPGNFIDSRPEFLCIRLFRGIGVQNFQQLVHAVQFQSRTKAAGEQLPCFNQAPEIPLRDRAGLQIGFQQCLVTQGGVFRDFLKILPKIHTSRGKLPVKGFQKLPFFHRGQVHFVDEQEGWHLVAFQQPPKGQRVGLHSIGAADDQNRAVQNLHGSLRLRGKVHMTRCVHQRNPAMGGFQQGLLGENGDAPGPFQRMGVKERILMVYPPQHPAGSRRIQKGLAQRRLSRVHMGQQSSTTWRLFHFIWHTE